MFLITHFYLKKKTFKNDKMRSHECLYFVFFIWNTVNQTFFFNFLLYSSFTAPSPNVENEQFLIEQTWRSTQERRSVEQTKQRLTFTFQ